MNKISIRSAEIFEKFPEIVAGVTVSTMPLDKEVAFSQANFGLNLLNHHFSGTILDENRRKVYQARRSLASLLARDAVATFTSQVHGNTVIIAPPLGDVESAVEADGIVTTQRHNLLCVVLADCGGILLCDPKNKVVGAVHSGWKGTKVNVVASTVEKMQTLGAIPEHMYAYISPLPCAEHYPVGKEFRKYFSPAFLRAQDDQVFFDNGVAISSQLKEAGVAHVAVDPACTIEDSQLHSHRRDQIAAGRFVAFIGLK